MIRLFLAWRAVHAYSCTRRLVSVQPRFEQSHKRLRVHHVVHFPLLVVRQSFAGLAFCQQETGTPLKCLGRMMSQNSLNRWPLGEKVHKLGECTWGVDHTW